MTPRRAIAWIVVAELLAMSLWFSASAVAPELSAEWQLGPAGRAALTSSVQLGFVVGALASAVLNVADRFAAQRVFALGALAGAACTAAIPVLGVGIGGAVALRFATGVALAGVYPPGMKLAASWSRSRRGLAIGLVVGALTLGSALPHLLGSFAVGFGSWRAVLYGAAALALVAAAVAALVLRPGPELAASAPFDWRQAARPFTERGLRLVTLGYLGHMWELYAMWTWVPIFLLEAFESAGLSVAAARATAFVTVGAGAAGCALAGLAADRAGRTLVVAASLVVSGTCCLCAGALGGAPVALGILCAIWGFAVVADSAQFSAGASELADRRYVGTALAVQTAAGFLLTLVTIQLVPWIEERAGWWPAFAVLAAGPAVGLAATLRLRALPEAERMAGGRR